MITEITEFEKIIREFLKDKGVDETGHNINSKKQDGMYTPKITSFKNYCYDELGFKNKNWELLLKNMSKEELNNSSSYFIETRSKKIKKGTLGDYFSITREFFKYLSSNCSIENSKLISEFNTTTDTEAIEEISLKHNLSKDKSSFLPIEEREAHKLINYFDKKYEISVAFHDSWQKFS